jgi:hypothetical protein
MLLKSTGYDLALALEFCEAYNVHRQAAVKMYVEMLLLARPDPGDDAYQVQYMLVTPVIRRWSLAGPCCNDNDGLAAW